MPDAKVELGLGRWYAVDGQAASLPRERWHSTTIWLMWRADSLIHLMQVIENVHC